MAAVEVAEVEEESEEEVIELEVIVDDLNRVLLLLSELEEHPDMLLR